MVVPSVLCVFLLGLCHLQGVVASPGGSQTCDNDCLNAALADLQTQVEETQQELLQLQGQVKKTNIVQCSEVDLFDTADNGPILNCAFTKDYNQTLLRVVWTGNIRMVSPLASAGCNRWYFTINGEECQSPAAIDALVYDTDNNNNIFRTAHLEGLCGVPAGDLMVTFNVGPCINRGASYPSGKKTQTGWSDTSRIIVEEIHAQDPGAIQ